MLGNLGFGEPRFTGYERQDVVCKRHALKDTRSGFAMVASRALHLDLVADHKFHAREAHTVGGNPPQAEGCGWFAKLSMTLDRVVGMCSRSSVARCRSHPRQKLVHAEWFRYVVVSAEIERPDLADLVAAAGEDNNGTLSLGARRALSVFTRSPGLSGINEDAGYMLVSCGR